MRPRSDHVVGVRIGVTVLVANELSSVIGSWGGRGIRERIKHESDNRAHSIPLYAVQDTYEFLNQLLGEGLREHRVGVPKDAQHDLGSRFSTREASTMELRTATDKAQRSWPRHIADDEGPNKDLGLPAPNGSSPYYE